MQVIGSLCWLLLVPAAEDLSPLTAREAALVVPFDQAQNYIGQDCLVYGTVVQTRNIGSRCFLNFHPDYRQFFTVVISQADFHKFPEPPEDLYQLKNVEVFGHVVRYGGKPEIIVTSPDQITIMTEGLPAPTTQPTSAPSRLPFSGVARIATFNVLNLFDGVDDPYHGDEGTPPKPRAELEKLAATIHKLDADVLALEEVENRFYLERFIRVLLRDTGYEHVALIEGNDYRGIDVAILSRFPVGPVMSYRHLEFPDGDGPPRSFQRDLLRARIEPPGAKPFDMFVVHLKSKSDGEAASLPLRMGEATQIRKIVDEILTGDPGARFVICGDFNDTLDSQPLQTILGSGARALRHLVDDLPEGERISFNQEPHRSLIDFILCSPAMHRCYQAGSVRIPQGSVEENGSDHNPVVARFDLR
jgi:endonuclease/exonuclease/phosphatase family metal-dependent hydrolase